MCMAACGSNSMSAKLANEEHTADALGETGARAPRAQAIGSRGDRLRITSVVSFRARQTEDIRHGRLATSLPRPRKVDQLVGGAPHAVGTMVEETSGGTYEGRVLRDPARPPRPRGPTQACFEDGKQPGAQRLRGWRARDPSNRPPPSHATGRT